MPKTISVGDVIRLAREQKKLSKVAFAKLVGVERQTVYDWENGDSAPNRTRAPKVAKVLGITLAELTDPMHANVANVTTRAQSSGRVPLIDWVNAGRGAEVVAAQPLKNAYEYVEVQSTVSADAFALRVQGHSMEPDFRDGDVIVVDPHRSPINNDFVVVELLPDGTAEGFGDVTFKQYRFRGQTNGSTSFDLQPMNPEFPTITINKGHPGRIVGTVVEHHRKL